jgi:hypothetical protein
VYIATRSSRLLESTGQESAYLRSVELTSTKYKELTQFAKEGGNLIRPRFPDKMNSCRLSHTSKTSGTVSRLLSAKLKPLRLAVIELSKEESIEVNPVLSGFPAMRIHSRLVRPVKNPEGSCVMYPEAARRSMRVKLDMPEREGQDLACGKMILKVCNRVSSVTFDGYVMSSLTT